MMISIVSISDLSRSLNGMAVNMKVLTVLEAVLPSIIEKSGLRQVNEIFDFLVETSYELLPLPIRMIIKKEAYVCSIIENKNKVINLIK